MLVSAIHFINTIEDQQDIFFLRQDNHDGFDVRVYQGRKGNVVLIEVSEGELDGDEATGLLIELGCPDLIPILIPKEDNSPKGEIAEINIENIDEHVKD